VKFGPLTDVPVHFKEKTRRPPHPVLNNAPQGKGKGLRHKASQPGIGQSAGTSPSYSSSHINRPCSRGGEKQALPRSPRSEKGRTTDHKIQRHLKAKTLETPLNQKTELHGSPPPPKNGLLTARDEKKSLCSSKIPKQSRYNPLNFREKPPKKTPGPSSKHPKKTGKVPTGCGAKEEQFVSPQR